MPARTALLIAIGDVVETGPPTTRRASSASASSSTAKLKNGFRAGHSASGSQHTPNRLRCHSETASEIRNSDDNLSTVSSLSDPEDDEVESGVQDGLSRALKMKKTRGIGPKSRTRLLSVESESTSNNGHGMHVGDEMDQGGPLSPRTRSTTKQEKKLRVNAPEFDEEVSFSEAPSGLSEEDFGDSNPPGETNGHSLDDPEESAGNNASQETLIPHNSSEGAKKRRKSSAEKFLEDNSEYYGIQDKKTKQRHKSASQETSPRVELQNGKHRRRRLVSSPGSNGVDPTPSEGLKSTSIIDTSTTSSFSSTTSTNTTISTTTTHISKRLLRVDVERLQVDNANHSKESDGESDGEREPVGDVGQNEEEQQQQQQQQPGEALQEGRPRYRKSKRQAAALAAQQMSERDRNQDSPSPKRRRTELDKLLEAGSSSFHFETARQASCRENGLGPIHVDVTDHHSNSSNDETQNKPAKASTTLKISVKKTKTRVVEVHADTDEDNDNEDDVDDVDVEEELVKEEEENEEENEEEVEEQPSRLKSKGGKKKRGHRRLLLTKEDLLDGPLHIAPKEDRKKKSGLLRRFSREPYVNDYLPRDLFESLDERLGRITSESVDVNGMSFSFEHTPFNEGWFQTYSRQDQGDEILFYPETHWFPLPYEMPISTFYTKKEGGTSGGPPSGKAKRKILEESASGSITPDESPRKTTRKGGSVVTAEPPPKSLRRSAMESRKKEARSSVSSSEGKKSGILARLGPKGAIIPAGLAGNLNDAHRKSPRCHASTKALLTCASMPEGGEEEPVDVGNPVPPSEDENPLIDECSNDSTFSHVSATNQNRKFKSESSQEYKDLSLNIELFLKQDDASLAGQESDGDRPSSLTFKKKKRRSSGKHTNNSASAQHSGEDPMDRIVAANVDPLLLDCLEDELPSVTIDEEIPGSEPLELLDNYETCDSMAQVCNSRWMRAMSIIPDPSPRKVFKTKRINSPPPVTVHRPELDDSSSEYATSVNEETGSVHSLESTTSSGRRKVKRKRNLTGFPNPKKRRKTPSLLNNVLTKRTIAASTSKSEAPSGKAAKQSAPVPKGKAPMGTTKGLAQISDESDVDADESGSDEEEDEDDKTQEVEGRSLRNVTRTEPKCYRDPDSDLDLGDDLKVPVRRKLKVPKTPSPKKVGKVTKKLKTPLKVPKKSSRHTRSKRK